MTGSSPPLPDLLAALKARHVAFLEARLVSDRSADEWRANAAAVHEGLLAARVGDVVDARRLADALDAVLTSDAVKKAAEPVARRVLALTLRESREAPGKVGDHATPETRLKLDALLDRPGLLPERLLREIAEIDAVDEVMRDVLYDALKEFSEKVNPFTAEWGVPALLRRAGPLGLGLGRGLDSVRAEFDKRLEPEIRRFLHGFSRRGLRRMAEFTIQKGDEPRFIAVRKRIAAWVLEQSIADLARRADEEALALAQEIGLAMGVHGISSSHAAARRRAVIEAAIDAHRDRTVGEALAALGVTFTPDLDALAAATWPVVRAALSTPAARAWLRSLVEEFYDSEIAALSGAGDKSS